MQAYNFLGVFSKCVVKEACISFFCLGAHLLKSKFGQKKLRISLW